MTALNAFKAMTCFLDNYYRKTLSDDVGSLLGNIQLFEDGSGTWDPAAWNDWSIALEQKESITVIEGFGAMTTFLEKWYAFTKSDDIAFILSGMKMDPAFFQDWIQSVEIVTEKNNTIKGP